MIEGASLNETDAVNEAILAREAGISLLVVGVSASQMPLTEWLGVASYPNININVFTVPDYAELPTIVNRLITSVNNGTVHRVTNKQTAGTLISTMYAVRRTESLHRTIPWPSVWSRG